MLRKNLTSLLLGGTLTVLGCQEIKTEPKVGVQIYSSSLKGDAGVPYSVNTINFDSVISDVDGDGKPDIVFGVTTAGRSPYYVFYRRNVGDGKFDDPTFLYLVDNWDYNTKIPLKYYHLSELPSDKYLKSLVDKVEESFKNK